MTEVHPRYLPPPYQDSTESGRLILRDGSIAFIRISRSEDQKDLATFFSELSAESRRRRFFSASTPPAAMVASMCDSSNPRSTLTLVVSRTHNSEAHIIAVGSYFVRDKKTAEVAFAVNDVYQHKGLGTLLLERLALLAVRQGITHFWAVTHADNRDMLNVFRESGFTVKERIDGGDIEVDLSVIPSLESVARLEMRDRIATTASLLPFFRPKSVAVIGASRDPSSIGFRILECLVQNRFQGPVYPVNPRATVISCLRAYPSVADLPEAADLAIVAVPRDAVPGVVDECAARGVRALVVISAGFAEVNAEGRELQRKLAEKVRGYGMRMIGPNCMGLLNTDPAVQLNASFSPVYPPAGRVAMSSQSGALGLAILDAARRFNLGLSTFVSVGNKADVSGNDLLQYWEEDEGTDVILLYLESFGNPRRFARIARRVSRHKPIVAIKSGRTGAGGRAAGSHTAALAANDVAVDALFRQTGVIRADTLEEMFDLASLLGSQPLPGGRRVAIVTNAGGPGILCADACEAGGLVIPELSATTRSHLAAALPPAASVGNPVDLIASATPEQYQHAVTTVLSSGEVDALIVIYIPVGLAETAVIAHAISAGVAAARQRRQGDKETGRQGEGETRRQGDEALSGSLSPCLPVSLSGSPPVLACLMAEHNLLAQAELEREKIPAYTFPEAAARVLCKAAAYTDWRSQPAGIIPDFADLDIASARDVCLKALASSPTSPSAPSAAKPKAQGPCWLSAEDTRTVLTAMRLPLVAGGVARTAEEAAELAGKVGYPVAVKLASRKLVHKTEVGGVCLHLTSAEDVAHAFREIKARLAHDDQVDAMEGVVVQPMLSGGVEVMVGVTQDPLFGPLIAFGLGGIHVEILADVCFRVTPLTDRDAAEMVRSIRGYRLLEGYRGHPPADIPAIEELLLRVSRLVEELPEIVELDLNPIFALSPGQGCSIVDARIQVSRTI